MNALNNVHRKPWYEDAIPLDELIETLLKIKADVGDKRCLVVGVSNPHDPTEHEVIAVQRRSELLDRQVGKHLNALAGHATDGDVEESSADAEFQLKQGEVIYITLGPATGKASTDCYEQ